MFWTDWGEMPKIERAGMDGDPSTRKVIVSTNLYWPNGLALDYSDTEPHLFWVDGKQSYIHMANLDGSQRTVIIAKSLPHPFALSLFRDSLYWTDWQTKAIYTYNMSSASPSHQMIMSNLYSPMDIHVLDASRQPPGEN